MLEQPVQIQISFCVVNLSLFVQGKMRWKKFGYQICTEVVTAVVGITKDRCEQTNIEGERIKLGRGMEAVGEEDSLISLIHT